MKIADFELELQQIDPLFHIIPHKTIEDMAGVYYDGLHQFSIPNHEIFDEIRPDYRNSQGMVHSTRIRALNLARSYVDRLKNEPGFAEGEAEDRAKFGFKR